MYINERTQYDKAQATISKKNLLSTIVKTRPSVHWAKLLQKTVDDSRIRGWAASIIWWSYPSKKSPVKGQLLYDMMEGFRPSAFDRTEELRAVFDGLGLPQPTRSGDT
tara:strand:- start:1609 stop:1932 length:324 start_codon:yes stop_codon:yes gene_type:complete